MDSLSISLLIASAGCFTGGVLCWLVMRSRIAGATARGKSEGQSSMLPDLVLAQERIEALDAEHQLAQASHEQFVQEAEQWRGAGELAHQQRVQLAEQASQMTVLKADLLASQERETASQQALQHQSASDAESTQTLKQVLIRVSKADKENAVLRNNLAAMAARLEDATAANAAPAAHVTELPLVEIQVVELQSLAKSIQQEFLVLAEVQRNFTAASSALQDVS